MAKPEWINPLLVVQLEYLLEELMDKSWMSTDRKKKRYEEGFAAFLRYAVNHLKEEDCLNHRACLVSDVEGHLFVNGIDQTYTTWNKHGEKDETTNSRPVNIDNGMHAEFEMGSPADASDEDFGMGTLTDASDTIDMMQAAKEFADDPIMFKNLLEDAEKPLYEGCPNFTKLSTIVQLFKLKSKHGASDMFFNELLPLIKDMLPKEGNLMARSTYQAKKILKAMGSGYTKIHACTNNCILYRNEYNDEKVCPTCKAPRWKVDREGKVYENVPAKRKFIMLSLLIDGAPGKNINVLLEPLVKDFQFLFENGKRTWDAYAQEMFTARAVVLWTINDYPSLGRIYDCPYAGYHGCVVCRKKNHSIRLHDSNKNVYVGYRRFLPYDHPFRKKKKAFGKTRVGDCSKPMTGEEIYEEVKSIKNSWGKKGKHTQVEDVQATPGKGGKMKRIRKISNEIDRSVEEEEGRETTYWSRLDLVRLGLKPELQPKSDVKGTILPAACYTLTADEKDIFLETLSELRVPEGYC
ncbi:uncharacterized protein LOC113315507 [Papaver somniferum]|uniref:uncharacterized protein LOC113315507 n=1 Tax=Papaver somniferum TaxID=3469 RepID=UPI000E6FBA2E|nr:uncharacterized protein LOC113315507 [Papaver somniferum]